MGQRETSTPRDHAGRGREAESQRAGRALACALTAALLACSSIPTLDDGFYSDGGGDGLSFTDAGLHEDHGVDLPPPDLPVADLPPPDLPPPDLPPPDLPPTDLYDACIPRCTGKDCGDDGCGGTCGGCAADQLCASYKCESKPLQVTIDGVPELVWSYKASNQCTFPDGPVRMFRDGQGRASAILAHATNRRVVSTTTDGQLTIVPNTDPVVVFDSPESTIESVYDSRMWIAGVWTDDGQTIRAVAHHEWYHPTLYTIQQCGVPMVVAAFGWINAVHHMTSTDGGATFETTKPFTLPISNQNDRLVLAPETYTYQGVAKPVYPGGEVRFGFFRPSNIVKEGSYYYIAVAVEETVREIPGDFVVPQRRGFLLARTSDIASGWPNGKWQLWTGAGWNGVSGVIENGAPHLFTHDPAHLAPRTVIDFSETALQGDLFTMTHSLTRSTVADRWLLLGHTASTGYVAYTTTKQLSQPDWTPMQRVDGSHTLKLGSDVHPWPVDEGGVDVSDWAGAYPAVIDHSSTGKVYMETGATADLYYVKSNGGLARDIYRVGIKITLQ